MDLQNLPTVKMIRFLADPICRGYLSSARRVLAGAHETTDNEELATLGYTRLTLRDDIQQLEAISSSETTRRRQARDETERPLHVRRALHGRTSSLDVDCPLDSDIEVSNVAISRRMHLSTQLSTLCYLHRCWHEQ